MGVLFQQSLIGIAFYVSLKSDPLFPVNQVGNQAAELGRVLDLVLRLTKDDTKHPFFLTQFFKDVAIVRF